MFLGHFATGFGAKRAAPSTSLGTLFLAAQLADLAWPALLATGVERVEIRPGATRVTPLEFVDYPWSHSLALGLLWGVLFGVVYYGARRDPRGAVVTGCLVPVHWVLDALVHRPDLPLWPGGPEVGLEIWTTLPGTLALELGLFAAGFVLYLRATRSRDRLGATLPWALALFLLAIYAANLLGPPPPSVDAIAWVGQAQWLIVLLGYWTDRHRSAGGAAPPGLARGTRAGETMDRKARLARLGLALSLLTTALAGLERLEAGKPRQGFLLLAGTLIGGVVYLVRRRRAPTAVEPPPDVAAVGRSPDDSPSES